MFNITTKSMSYLLNIAKMFSTSYDWDNDRIDPSLKSYCQSEYGKDWYWAYNSYKIDGRFPNPLKRN